MSTEKNIEDRMFDFAFNFEGKAYNGWGRASARKDEDDVPASYHIVLNGVFFGNISYNGEQWETDRQREKGLVQKVGELITAVNQ